MLFSAPAFLFLLLPVFFLVYFLLAARWRNAFALLASCAFYAWGEPIFILVVLASILADWILAGLITTARAAPQRKAWLVTAVAANLALLGYFKYANFFVDNVNRVLGSLGLAPLGWMKVALPIGVSFIVFEKITFLVDVYEGRARKTDSLLTYATYILLFPKLLAGPIVKYHDISGQLENRPHSIASVSEGLSRFIVGLAKKVLLADALGVVSDQVFRLPPSSLPVSQAWVGALCFTFQIYYDFSGYSDMAIGLLRMMGFSIGENFDHPYRAASFTEFWRRWHISLTTWIRHYLYIPLGGNRCSPTRCAFNLWICIVLSGLWHGASWTFVAWGIYHGAFLAADRSFRLAISRRLPRFPSVGLTFLLVVNGWVIFRSTTLGQAAAFLGRMYAFPGAGVHPSRIVYLDNSTLTILVLSLAAVVLFALFPRWPAMETAVNRVPPRPLELAGVASTVALLLLCLAKVSTANFTPFIYFRF
jgi:alginate O-acetyltransferase complex protein AlgI